MDGPHDGRTSALELDGAESPIFFERQFEVRGGGCVAFRAAVVRADGSVLTADQGGQYASRLEESPSC